MALSGLCEAQVHDFVSQPMGWHICNAICSCIEEELGHERLPVKNDVGLLLPTVLPVIAGRRPDLLYRVQQSVGCEGGVKQPSSCRALQNVCVGLCLCWLCDVQEKAEVPATTDWKEFTAPDGRKYYYNKTTKESKWTLPDELKPGGAAAKKPAAAATQPPPVQVTCLE